MLIKIRLEIWYLYFDCVVSIISYIFVVGFVRWPVGCVERGEDSVLTYPPIGAIRKLVDLDFGEQLLIGVGVIC